jgi:hypothetical protein
MDAFLHRWLRPTRRAQRLVASLVVVALLGWLSLSAGHVHVGVPAASAHAAADLHAPGDHGDAGDRSHACSLCAALERAAGPSAGPAFAAPAGPDRTGLAPAAVPVPVAAAAAPYRSRAPPHA